MKRFLTSLAMIAVMAICGCTQGTPGGPGTTDATNKKPTFGLAEETFNLSVPVMATSVQQGEKTEMTIGIKRGTNFDEDVAIIFGEIPAGVTIEPASPQIKRSDADTKIVLTAVGDAPVGEFKVKLSGHPTKGGDAHVELKLTVMAKDSFTLIPPRLSTALKQGESKTVSIAIKRDKTFDQDVALTFGDTPTGVTLEPNSPVLKHGEAEIPITIVAADDASLLRLWALAGRRDSRLC